MGIRAIVCDDHPAFGRGLAFLLPTVAEDLEVVEVVTSADEAERKVRELLPDVVLMDIRMPRVNGIEATRRIRSASPTTKVLILTVSDEQADLYDALRAGATGYVTKDRQPSEIVDAVRSVVTGHLVIPADLARRFVSDLERSDPLILSDTEREILGGIATGETNKELATRLHLSERTLRRRIEDIYEKLHLADRIEAAIWASEQGLGRKTQ